MHNIRKHINVSIDSERVNNLKENVFLKSLEN